MRIGQRDGDIERLAGRNAVYAQRQLVAGLLILLEFVYLIHVRGRGTVNGGDDITDLQTLTGCLCAGINGIYLHAGHLAVRGLNVLAGDANGRTAGNVTVLNQLINNILGGVDRDGKAHALNGGAAERIAGQLSGRDADHLTVLVDECAAGVAVVDGSIGLNQRHNTVIDGQIAVDSGNTAAGDGVRKLHAAGRTDRVGILARLQLIRVTELCGGQVACRRYLDDRKVGLLIRADDLGIKRGAVAQLYRNRLRAVHNVVVGDDVAVLAHDDARAAACALRGGGDNRYDRRIDLFVDILTGHAVRGVVVVRGIARIRLRLAVDLQRRRGIRGRCRSAGIAVCIAAERHIADNGAACKQQARSCYAAQTKR